MSAGGGAGVDQLVRLETRILFKRQYVSSSSDLVIGHTVKGPFITAKKKARQLVAESRQNPFSVESCLSLSTRNKNFAVWRLVNSAFSKLCHAM